MLATLRSDISNNLITMDPVSPRIQTHANGMGRKRRLWFEIHHKKSVRVTTRWNRGFPVVLLPALVLLIVKRGGVELSTRQEKQLRR